MNINMEGIKITPAEDWLEKYDLHARYIPHGSKEYIHDSERTFCAFEKKIEEIIKEAQKQAEEVGFNKGLELAAEKATVIMVMEKTVLEDCVQLIRKTVVDKQSILNLKHSDELKV